MCWFAHWAARSSCAFFKGPPSKTHAESDDIKPRTHKRLEHTKVKVPEVADFQNELPLHGFMLEPWKKSVI